MAKEKTEIKEVDLDLDNLWTGVDSDSVIVPEEKENRITKPMTPDTTFLDKIDDEPADDPEKDDEEDKDDTTENLDDILDPDKNVDDDPEKNKGGRPNAMVAVAKKLIEDGKFVPFVDDNNKEIPLDSYTEQDFIDLINDNLEAIQDTMREQFFYSLPQELQAAYSYYANGGTDMKTIFRDLSVSQSFKDLNVDKPQDQKVIIREYLQATGWTPEEIQDELYSLEDKGELNKKAKQFKPKLDNMQEQIVKRRVAEKQAANKKRQEQAYVYMESVYNTLAEGKLGDLKLDNTIQNQLYTGLVETNYTSAFTGKQTNRLGHLLEKYQFVEPNHGLIAEVLWLLSDPDGYKSKIKETATKENNAQVRRTLKSEEQRSRAGGNALEDNPNQSVRRGIPKQKRNFFER